MTVVYSILFFVYGTIFGSFYNVVGDRLPNKESIVKPRSHCSKCNHILTPIELIPILSYIIQGGKCKKCKTKLSIFYPLFELISGLTFMMCYLIFGLSIDIIIPLTISSMFLITVVSDLEYMIILDEVLIVTFILLIIEMFFINGIEYLVLAILNGLIAGGIMALIKLFGDFIFKKESMGGGDIKLLFFMGLVLGWENALLAIFIGSFVGFPISLIVLQIKKTNIIPFGPFLIIGATFLLFSQISFQNILGMLL